MSSKKETIIYGGAFNPPTRAHQAILQGCVEYGEPIGADVWLLPSASRQDKTIETRYERRLELCRALRDDVIKRTVQVEISTLEIDRPTLTETYDTVCELRDTYLDRTFTWVFGADSLQTIENWHRGEWLRDNLSMLVIERAGSPRSSLGRNATYLALRTGDVSSTEVRRRMSTGEPYADLVGEHVAALLERTVVS